MVEAGVAGPGDKEIALREVNYAVHRSDQFPDLGYRFRETKGWVLLRFGGDNEEEKKEGHRIINEVLSQPDIPRAWYERRLRKYKSFLNRQTPTAP